MVCPSTYHNCINPNRLLSPASAVDCRRFHPLLPPTLGKEKIPRRRRPPRLSSAAAASPSPPSKKIQLSSAAVVHHDRHLPPLPSAAAAVTAVKEKSDRRTQPPLSVSTTAMWHPPKGVIHLDGDSSSNKSVGSDVEEVVMWDHSLRSSNTFQRAVLSPSPRALKHNHSFFSCFWISPQVTTSKVGRCRQSHSIQFRMLVSLGGRRRHRARRSGLCVSLLSI